MNKLIIFSLLVLVAFAEESRTSKISDKTSDYRDQATEALQQKTQELRELMEPYFQKGDTIMQKNKWIAAPILILGGILLALKGRHFVRPVLFFFGWLSCVGFLLVFPATGKYALKDENGVLDFSDTKLQEITKDELKEMLQSLEPNYLVIVGYVIIGLIVGFLVTRFISVGIGCLGAGLGFILSDNLWGFITSKIWEPTSQSQHAYGHLAIVIICILGCMVLAFMMTEYTFIIGTAVGGAQLVGKGIALLWTVGEDDVANTNRNVYLKAIWIAIAIVAAFYQWREYEKEDDETKDKRREQLQRPKKKAE